jgi:hypothetical protein
MSVAAGAEIARVKGGAVCRSFAMADRFGLAAGLATLRFEAFRKRAYWSRVKYWEVIADNLSKAGWNRGLRVVLSYSLCRLKISSESAAWPR